MGLATAPRIRRAHAGAADARRAVQELAAAICQERAWHFVFASPAYPRPELEAALREAFGTQLLGCTTAGEITPEGYGEGTLTGLSLPEEDARLYPFAIRDLGVGLEARVQEIGAAVQTLLAEELRRATGSQPFGILLVDGLSMREEELIGQLQTVLPGVPLVGGSAGDGLRFESTAVFAEGQFRVGAAVFVLGLTTHPVHVFKSQHFTPTTQKLVVTRADAERRIVHTIDGRPAAEAYARLLRVDPAALGAEHYSRHPIMLRIGGDYYVRSIQRANPDGSLTFYCAIDEGLVLTVAEGDQILESLEQCFRDVRQYVPAPRLILGFECILRRLEVVGEDLAERVGDVLSRNRVIGFHTYGEQFGAVHVNQTFTGLALG